MLSKRFSTTKQRERSGKLVTTKQISDANKNLPVINIKGKNYVMVKDRVKAFREHFPDFAIITEIISLTDESVTIKATIEDSDGRKIATGHAQELKSASNINKTSYVENCETSAIGRAIGLMGIGIDDSFGSADEVANAMMNQANEKITDRQKAVLVGMFEKYNLNPREVLDWVGASTVDEMTAGQYAKASSAIDKKYGKVNSAK